MLDFYISGLKFKEETYSFKERIALCCRRIPYIISDAIAHFGPEVIVLIILWEYALTPNQAISHAEKKEGLLKLRECLKYFPNVILIPGTFSCFEKMSNTKEEKIRANYQSIINYSLFNDYDEIQKQKKIISEQRLTDRGFFYHENATYLMTYTARKKHKKTTPHYERDNGKVELDQVIYDIGTNLSPTYTIPIADSEIKMAVLICKEYFFLLDSIPMNTLITILISNYIESLRALPNTALFISYDAKRGLEVHIDKNHLLAKHLGPIYTEEWTLGKEGDSVNKIFCFEGQVQVDSSFPSSHSAIELFGQENEIYPFYDLVDNNNLSIPVSDEADFSLPSDLQFEHCEFMQTDATQIQTSYPETSILSSSIDSTCSFEEIADLLFSEDNSMQTDNNEIIAGDGLDRKMELITQIGFFSNHLDLPNDEPPYPSIFSARVDF